MADRPYTVLFLCTGNSARSILAEALTNHLGAPHFQAVSAGSQPAGRVNPFAQELLQAEGLWRKDYHSKSWDVFTGADAQPVDFMVTVCASAHGEVCPIWPGHPTTAHWGYSDPAAVEGSDAAKRAAFREIYHRIRGRLTTFFDAPVGALDREALGRRFNSLAGMA